MKILAGIILILGSVLSNANAQQTVIDTLAAPTDNTLKIFKKIFDVKINTITNQQYKGYIIAISDSTILVNISNDSITQQFRYSDIEKITFKRKGGTLKGFWKGAIVGASAGFLAGAIAGSRAGNNTINLSAGETIPIGIGGGAFAGAFYGAVIGSIAKKTFVLHGNKQNFLKMKEKLKNAY